MDVVGLLNNINDKSDMFAVKTWTSEWSNSFQENQVRIDFCQHVCGFHKVKSVFLRRVWALGV